jgi:hypothetical protein
MGIDLQVKLRDQPKLLEKIKEVAAQAAEEVAREAAETLLTLAGTEEVAVDEQIHVQGDMVWVDADFLLVMVIRHVFSAAVQSVNIDDESCTALTVFVHLPGGLTMLAAAKLEALVFSVIRRQPRMPREIIVRVLLESLSAALFCIKGIHIRITELPKKLLVIDMGGGTVNVSLNHIEYLDESSKVTNFALELNVTDSAHAGWNQTAEFRRACNDLIRSCFKDYVQCINLSDNDVSLPHPQDPFLEPPLNIRENRGPIEPIETTHQTPNSCPLPSAGSQADHGPGRDRQDQPW